MTEKERERECVCERERGRERERRRGETGYILCTASRIIETANGENQVKKSYFFTLVGGV